MTAFKGTPVSTVGDLPAQGAQGPDVTLVGSDFATVNRTDGRRTVLNIFPSIDTGVCAQSVRTFNGLAAEVENTEVICASRDLPFALARFCGAEGIENVTAASAFRSDFGQRYGVTMADGPMEGLLARSVVVLDVDGTVLHTQLVADITEEPDYDAAIAVL